MNYGALVSEAFWLTWRNRFLWFFGLFAGGGASFNFNVPSSSSDFTSREDVSPTWTRYLEQWATNNLGLIFTVAALAILVFLCFIILHLLSQGALVDSIAALRRDESRRFSSTWVAGVTHFWRVLGLMVLFLLLGLGLFLLIAAPAALAVLVTLVAIDSVGLRILFIVLVTLMAILLFVLLGVPLTIIGKLALRELVIRRERIVGSITGGFDLFRRNLGRSLLVWLIQVVLLFAAGVMVGLVLLVLGLVLFALVAALYSTGLTTVALVVGVVALVIFLIPALIAGGILGTFGSSYWTLAYLLLSTGGATPRSEGM